MQLVRSTVGRKVLVAISGQLMVLFVIVHLAGNSSIFIPGGINAYAAHLHALAPLLWSARVILIAAVVIHIFYGVQLTLENRRANHVHYAVKRRLKANFAGENMIWTGLLMLAFVAWHLLQFTFRVTPDVASRLPQLSSGTEFDVYAMVVGSFQHGAIAAVYLGAMVVLFLHLFHGIQAFFQTMGWEGERSLPLISRIGRLAAFAFLLGYSAIPVTILTHLLT
ncbi:MAG TPA: succinate dehydrogenase cytochrome b subunit [Geobacteraceae bacterium]|nr:succinate dehydrogenase cytochrome b subunit [Geobacteraceae bacterium]